MGLFEGRSDKLGALSRPAYVAVPLGEGNLGSKMAKEKKKKGSVVQGGEAPCWGGGLLTL